MNNICCLFINHSSKYDDRFNEMKKSVDYIDFYNYNPNWEKIRNVYGKYMMIDKNIDKKPSYSGNVIFALLYFKLFIPDYDYYFFCENDVLFTGDYKLLFDELTKDIYSYDAILDRPLHKNNDNMWYWIWNDKDYKLFNGFNRLNCYNNLFTFFCLSNQMVISIINKYFEGWRGHQELVLSCLLKLFNGNYDYVINHFEFINYPFTHNITEQDLKLKNTLIHPVKI